MGESPSPLATAHPASDDFVEVFRYHYPRLVRALVLAGAPQPRAEDIAQESFARMFRNWRRVRLGTSPGGYVFRTAFRLLRRRGLVPGTALDDDLADPAAGPEDRTIATVDLERALAAMPPRRRACALLCWCGDVSTADAAEALGVSVGTVRKQLELGRRQLRAATGL